MHESAALRFDRFELQLDRRRLLQGGLPAALGSRAFDVLAALAERRDRIVTKGELLDLAWPDLVVEENNLQVQISALRKLLGPQAIATIPGRGYRFSAALDGPAADQPGAATPAAGGALPTGGVTLVGRATNLPRALPLLYGRAADLQALGSLLESHRLVTVVGAGGIGKSRLAEAAAHAWAGRGGDGTWMVELAGLSDPDLLANTVARALGITLVADANAAAELVSAIEQRQMLLVLDNCEHLLDAAAALVQTIVERAPQVVLLATSQEPLRLPGEQQYRLTPLAMPAASNTSDAQGYGAIALFEARVRAVDPRFTLDAAGLDAALDICRRLDGLPLAIELAAARVGTLGLLTVQQKLDARFKLLTGGSRTHLRRHQTLRAALEWSHQLLNDAEKAVFRRLGVFAGGFTMETAQTVAGDEDLDEWAVLDHLAALVEKSLVVAEAGELPRYRLLESARAFALEQLAAGETAAMLRRHAVAMSSFLQRVDNANLDGDLRTDQFAALVLPELDNLRAAYEWATSESGELPLAVSLAAHAGALIDYAAECIDWLVPLRQQVEDGSLEPAIAARYWRALSAGNMTGHVLRTVQLEAAVRASTLYRAARQSRRLASTLTLQARHLLAGHDVATAQPVLGEARALIQPDWPPEYRIRLMRADAVSATLTGRKAEALAIYREIAQASFATGDWRLEVIDRSNLCDVLWDLGEIEEADALSGRLAEEMRARPVIEGDMAMVLANWIGILAELGRIDEASAVSREALPIFRRTRMIYVETWVYLFWRRGQLDAAAILLGASDAERTRFGTPHQKNEARLIEATRAGLEKGLPRDAFARAHAEGVRLEAKGWHALLTEVIAPSLELRE